MKFEKCLRIPNLKNSANEAEYNEAINLKYIFFVKGALEGLRQSLITESLLKTMKNAFYFT